MADFNQKPHDTDAQYSYVHGAGCRTGYGRNYGGDDGHGKCKSVPEASGKSRSAKRRKGF